MRILFIADIFGAPGRRAIEGQLPGLREQMGLDLVVANGENAADGVGITSRIATRLFAAGVDAITLGNHAYRQR
ncbi:MAG: YmdB family metallophosphoesterase, partial [Chloroflexi bacterium]